MDTNQTPEKEISDSETMALILGKPIVRLDADSSLMALIMGEDSTMREEAIRQLVQDSYKENQKHTWLGERGDHVYHATIPMKEIMRCVFIAASHMKIFQDNEHQLEFLPVYSADTPIDIMKLTELEVNAHELAILTCYLMESLLIHNNKAAPKATQYSTSFISPDRQRAISVNNEVFLVGETVGHQGAADQAVIQSFEIDEETNDIKVMTSRGTCTINFLVKLNNTTTHVASADLLGKHQDPVAGD